ncbi:hypothetical protein VP01_1584g1 [Puccinia sorghi]|uniref:Uncharacterized protein n=1 Tax=Puccinia sorghi TaxID=27349 RepID=A0A0L6VJF0_9BASI|nr:hypothetical protein VP01_1584g1 [Puccinia sorghi]
MEGKQVSQVIEWTGGSGVDLIWSSDGVKRRNQLTSLSSNVATCRLTITMMVCLFFYSFMLDVHNRALIHSNPVEHQRHPSMRAVLIFHAGMRVSHSRDRLLVHTSGNSPRCQFGSLHFCDLDSECSKMEIPQKSQLETCYQPLLRCVTLPLLLEFRVNSFVTLSNLILLQSQTLFVMCAPQSWKPEPDATVANRRHRDSCRVPGLNHNTIEVQSNKPCVIIFVHLFFLRNILFLLAYFYCFLSNLCLHKLFNFMCMNDVILLIEGGLGKIQQTGTWFYFEHGEMKICKAIFILIFLCFNFFNWEGVPFFWQPLFFRLLTPIFSQMPGFQGSTSPGRSDCVCETFCNFWGWRWFKLFERHIHEGFQFCINSIYHHKLSIFKELRQSSKQRKGPSGISILAELSWNALLLSVALFIREFSGVQAGIEGGLGMQALLWREVSDGGSRGLSRNQWPPKQIESTKHSLHSPTYTTHPPTNTTYKQGKCALSKPEISCLIHSKVLRSEHSQGISNLSFWSKPECPFMKVKIIVWLKAHAFEEAAFDLKLSLMFDKSKTRIRERKSQYKVKSSDKRKVETGKHTTRNKSRNEEEDYSMKEVRGGRFSGRLKTEMICLRRELDSRARKIKMEFKGDFGLMKSRVIFFFTILRQTTCQRIKMSMVENEEQRNWALEL